jgi:hypothetical protein
MNAPSPLPVAAVLAAVSLLLAACGGGSTKLDVEPLRAPFASAAAELKAPAEAALQALQAGRHAEGLQALLPVARARDKLTDEQRDALAAVAANVQIIATQAAGSDNLAVQQAVEDLMAALENRPASKVSVNPNEFMRPQ